MGRSHIVWSVMRSLKTSALRCCWVMTDLKHLMGECQILSELKDYALPLLTLYNSKLISEAVGRKYTMRWRMDGWKMEAGGQMVGWEAGPTNLKGLSLICFISDSITIWICSEVNTKQHLNSILYVKNILQRISHMHEGKKNKAQGEELNNIREQIWIKIPWL